MYHHARLPLFLTGLLTLLLVLPACSTAERAADTTADAAEEVGEGAVDVAEDAGEAVVDAAGTAWNSVADLFDDDGDADAAALVRPTMAGAAQGTVRFYETDGGLRIAVSLRDLPPGAHGFHIHQNPDCSAADTDNDGEMEAAGAAGGHWDPMNTNNHGAPTENLSDKHIGDLGNVEAGAGGTVETTFTVENWPVDEYDVTDRAVVVHAGRDDLETDPSGGGGTPLACGVIEGR